MSATQVQVTVVSQVAQHQADASPCLVREEDFSGAYLKLNGRTLYSPGRGVFLDLDRTTMAAALRGQAVRVARSSVS